MTARRVRRRRVAAMLLTFLALGLAACGSSDQPLNSLDPQGPAARDIDGLFKLTFWIATAIFVVVQAAIIVAMVVFRDRPGRKEPKQTHGNTRLEVVWTVIPVLILASIAVPTVRTVFDLTDCADDALRVEVIGHQWWFEYQYPDYGITTANVLAMPTGREVCLEMTSEDVMHNFWVPKLQGKRYLIPGQTTDLKLEADAPGDYWGHCAEFCGLSHAKMRARVLALDQVDFDAWVANNQAPAVEPEAGSLAAQGKEVYANGACTGCHVIDGVNELDGAIGPDLTHFADRNVFAGAALDTTPENLKAWLADPPEVKPGSFMPNLNLSETEIDALIAYLEILR